MRKRGKVNSEFNDPDAELGMPLASDVRVIQRHNLTDLPPQPDGLLDITGGSPKREWLRFHLGWRFGLIHDWLTQQLKIEQAHRGGFLWMPVLIGSGNLLYIHLHREPWGWAFPIAALVLGLLARIGRTTVLKAICLGVALIALGASLAQWRVARLNTITLDRHHVTAVTGQVTRMELRPDGRVRYTLQVVSMELPQPWPQKVRLTSRKGSTAFAIGNIITGRTRIGPPPGPALPGGYDFRFFAWFDGIGGSGFFLGHPNLNKDLHAPLTTSTHINAVRHQIGEILRAALPAQSSALARALIIGDRSGIDETTNEALRRSGLAHILAISGLHMALVSMTVIGLVRLMAALHMDLVSHQPVKKWAGGLGLIFASVYLLLSGANVSTQRAYLMVAIMLFAVIVDRRALTMRNVALAAIVVLAVAPEALLHPGFQMSFAAVAGLVSAFEAISKREANAPSGRPGTSMGLIWLKSRNYVFGLALVPLIAGTSTALFAAHHFYRVAPLGLLANMLAMPVVSIAVMPLALLGMVLMPFGLEKIALVPMGLAVQMVVAIAEWVAGLSPAGSTGYVPRLSLACGTLGLLIATLCRSRLKWAACACFALAALGLSHRPIPDLIVAESGRQVGLRIGGNTLVLSKPNAEKFTTRLWREAFRLKESDKEDVGSTTHRRCDAFGCVLQRPGLVIAHIHNTARLNMDCRLADILLVPYRVPWACEFLPEEERPLVIDANALQKSGAHAIYWLPDSTAGTHKTIVQTARPNSGRPWQ